MKYANATQILPAELISEIKRYFTDGMLFIPKGEIDRKERASLVVQLVEQNVPAREVAMLAELTPQHVRLLARKHGATKGEGNKV